jgi:hypothetical protein
LRSPAEGTRPHALAARRHAADSRSIAVTFVGA